MQNKLILGDNLEILKSLPSESVDLIYIDPPFFSNRNYEVIWGDEGEVRSFKDRWSGGMDHYIAWLKERVEEMYRILKETGSFYLHCDWHADAYIRVNILDKVFGMNNFRNEIIYCYAGGGIPKTDYPRKHDNIYRYSKTNKYIFNIEYRQYSDGTKKIPRHSTTSGGKELDLEKGTPLNDWWPDLSKLTSYNKEFIGYPTQKPEALLERIIKASSNEGDVVLDAFCGGGTTIAVADRLKRQWIGIDQSVQAIKVTDARLQNQGANNNREQKNSFDGFLGSVYSVKLHKYDYDTLRYSDAFEFESWIIEQFGGEPNTKQRGDMGLDGKKNGVPIQVKRSDNLGRNVVDNFKSAMGRFYGKAFDSRKGDKEVDGYIIAFSFGKGAFEEIARLKNEEGLIIQAVKVEDIIPIATKPKLELSFEDKGLDAKENRIIEFTAKTDVKMELFQWDFNYIEKNGFKAEIMMDESGKQTYEFKSGEHVIACKAIDKEGLETIETIRLKINGVVKKT